MQQARPGWRIVVAVVEQRARPFLDVSAKEREVALERRPASRREGPANGVRIDRAGRAHLVAREVPDLEHVAEGAHLTTGDHRRLVQSSVAELGQILRAHEVVKGVPVVDVTVLIQMEHAEVRVGEQADGEHAQGQYAETVGRNPPGGQRQKERSEREYEDAAGERERLVAGHGSGAGLTEAMCLG